jgi:hypothetical protein
MWLLNPGGHTPCRCEDIPLNCKPYTGPACAKVVPTYGTCGGLGSDCVGCQCKDGPWDGYCCETGEWRVTWGGFLVRQVTCRWCGVLAGCLLRHPAVCSMQKSVHSWRLPHDRPVHAGMVGAVARPAVWQVAPVVHAICCMLELPGCINLFICHPVLCILMSRAQPLQTLTCAKWV